MTTTPPDDVAAMFDLPPLPPSAQPERLSVDAEEAALAAEIASAMEADGVAADAPDSRAMLRVDVAWPARMQLPGGRVIELAVRNISARGVGLTSHEPVPAYAVVGFEMTVPPLVEGGSATPVKGTIKTTYTVVQGSAILCGGTWQQPPVDLELVTRWIDALRR